METIPPTVKNQLTDIVGLRASGIFAEGNEPSIRSLREWTKLRRIPHVRLGSRIYYDPADVASHIRGKLKVPTDERASVLARPKRAATGEELAGVPRWSRRGSKGFKISDFRNPSGAISYRVDGMLRGVRIRRNFQLKTDAEAEVRALEIEQVNAANEYRTVITRLNEAQVREAEVLFQRLIGKPNSLSFYVNHALATYREPECNRVLAEAVSDYVAARTKDHERTLISFAQFRSIKREMETFSRWFPKAVLPQLTPETLNTFLERGSVSLKGFNNRRGILSTFFKFARRKGWISSNPIKKIPQLRIAHRRGSATTISADQAAELMRFLEDYENGALVPYFALCLFAGVRPCYREGEMSRLKAPSVNLDTGVIHIEPEVSKVRMKRMVTVQPNLAAWLRAYPIRRHPLIPKRMWALHGFVFRKFALSYDVLRHTFISMHVGKFRSIAEAALQAGNSEEIIRRHYLNLKSQTEASRFFEILPRGPGSLSDEDEIAIASPS